MPNPVRWVAWLAVSLAGSSLVAGFAWGEAGETAGGLPRSAAEARGNGRPPGEAAPPELVTDRPDFTDSAVVVPWGSLQLETGFTWERGDRGIRQWDLPQVLLRWGVGHRSELRLGPPGFFRMTGSDERLSGFGDLYLGLKQQLGPLRSGIDLALIPAVSLPTGSRRLTSGAVDPEVKLTWSRDLAHPWSAGGSFGFFWPTEEEKRTFTWAATLEAARPLGHSWKAFLEYAGEFPEHGSSRHLLHHGYTYAITPTSQADVHFGFGLSRAAPEFFLGGGYSARY